MSIPVRLDELSAELDRRSNVAYLLTVGEDGRAHCVAAALEWSGGELVVPAGGTSVRNAAARGHVVLLSPPAAGLLGAPPGEGYSLIVDAEVTRTTPDDVDGPRTVRVRPVHAVLHRPVVTPGGGDIHDCVHVYEGT